MAESNLNEGIFDISKDNALSKLFPKGFELVIKHKDGKITHAEFSSYKEARQAAEKTTASDILKAFIIVKKEESEKLSRLLNKPDSLILAAVEKGKIDNSKINKVLQADKEAQAKEKEAKKQQKKDDKANRKLNKALDGKIVKDPAKAEEAPKTDEQELGADPEKAAETEAPKEAEAKPEESKPEAEAKPEEPKAEAQKPEAEAKPEEPKAAAKPEEPAAAAEKPNRYKFTPADSAKSAVSRKVKIALAKIGVDVNGEEGQKKVQQVKDTLFGRQTANQAEKGKTAVGESYLYMKEGKNKMNPEEIKEKEEKDFEENPFEYDDWDVEFEPRIDFDIDAPEFDGGFGDDDIDKTEVVVKAEVPAEAVESIPEDGKAKVELPIEGEADEEEAEEEPEEEEPEEESEKGEGESAIDVIKGKFDAKKVDNQLIISKKGEMDDTDSDKISVELADDEFEALKKGFEGSIEGYDIDKMVEALNEADEDEVECQLCHEMLNKADAEKIDGIGYVCEACKEAICDKGLEEDAHAQYAKPEGDRVAAYNNALKYAKKESKPFIYGYTNRAGKFFAAETPMKVAGSPADAEKEFRSRYKNCNTVYVAYPEKGFVDENLEEDKKADESPVDPEAAKLEVHTMLNDLVADEIEAINGYDDAKAKIMDTPIEHKESILDTIDHIKGEEQEHIDELIAATTEIPFDKEEDHDLAAEEEAPAEETLDR